MKIGSCNVNIHRLQNVPNCAVVTITGYIEKGNNSDEIKEYIMKLGEKGYINLIIDCSKLRFHLDVDFTFFPVLSALIKKEFGGDTVFVNLDSKILSTIAISEMDKWTPTVETIEEAIQIFSEKRREESCS